MKLVRKMNPVANSTREMGPGSRHDTLDDHCGHRNWKKSVNFGTYATSSIPHFKAHIYPIGNQLHRKMCLAIPSYIKHQAAFTSFNSTLEAVRPEQVDEWNRQLAAWEQDHSNVNPYKTSREGMHVASLTSPFFNHFFQS
jgi:hypothetical protein